MKKASIITLLTFLLLLVAVPALAQNSWRPPDLAAPNCTANDLGCYLPINVSSVEQIKNGALSIWGNFLVGAKDLYVKRHATPGVTGNVGVGTVNPTANFDVDGSLRFRSAGTAAANSVLAAVDAQGNAAWKTLEEICRATGSCGDGNGGGVTKIIAGENITVRPESGVGEVTISAAGGSNGGTVRLWPENGVKFLNEEGEELGEIVTTNGIAKGGVAADLEAIINDFAARCSAGTFLTAIENVNGQARPVCEDNSGGFWKLVSGGAIGNTNSGGRVAIGYTGETGSIPEKLSLFGGNFRITNGSEARVDLLAQPGFMGFFDSDNQAAGTLLAQVSSQSGTQTDGSSNTGGMNPNSNTSTQTDGSKPNLIPGRLQPTGGGSTSTGTAWWRLLAQADNNSFNVAQVFSGGSVKRFSILSNGNVGIGIPEPTTDLDVDGQVRLRGGGPAEDKILASDANGLGSWKTIEEVCPECVGDSFWGGSLTGNISNLNSGNVGIGTTDPASKLHIVGDNNPGGSVRSSGASIEVHRNSEQIGGFIDFKTQAGEDYDGRIYAFNNNLAFQTYQNAGVLRMESPLQIAPGNPAENKVLAALDANGTATWMTLEQLCAATGSCGDGDDGPTDGVTGRGVTNYVTKWENEQGKLTNSQIFDDGSGVGVNTTDTRTNLHVSGSSWLEGNSEVTGELTVSSNSPVIRFGHNAGGSPSSEAIASNRAYDGVNNVYGLDFYTNSQNRLAITHDGNVGIGTVNPSGNLTVSAPQNATIAVGDQDGVGDGASGLQFLNTGQKNVGLRFDGTNTVYLEDAGNSNSPATWYGATPAHLAIRNGNLDVNGSVSIRGGNPAAGRVLTSDAEGDARWGTMGCQVMDSSAPGGGGLTRFDYELGKGSRFDCPVNRPWVLNGGCSYQNMTGIGVAGASPSWWSNPAISDDHFGRGWECGVNIPGINFSNVQARVTCCTASLYANPIGDSN